MPRGRAAALCRRCVGFGVFCALDVAAWALVCAPELWICDLLLNMGPLLAAAFPGGSRRGCCGTPPGDGAAVLQLCAPGRLLLPGAELRAGSRCCAGGRQRDCSLCHCSWHRCCLVFEVKYVLAELWLCPCLQGGVLPGHGKSRARCLGWAAKRCWRRRAAEASRGSIARALAVSRES